MNFESIIALLLLVENNGRYLLIDIIDPLSQVDNVQSTSINSYARSRRLEFQKKNFKNFEKTSFRSLNIENNESDTTMVTNIPNSELPKILLQEPVIKTLKDTCKEWGDCMEVFGDTPQRKICEKMCSGMVFFCIHSLNSLTSY